MSHHNEVVRKQLGRTIKIKEGLIRRLRRQEEQQRRDAAALAKKASDLQAEVDELTTHLASLGGPVEVESA